MEIQFLNQYRIELPDQFANERSQMTPESLSERLASGAWEREEITLLRKYLNPADSVLEMGACIGVLSVVTHSMLAKSSRHTVIEADPKLIPALERNRDLNGCGFEIINAIAGVPDGAEQTFRTSDFILGGSQFKETGGVVSLPVVGLSRFKEDHDFLIMDIEGGEYRFIDTFLEDLRGFSKLMIEFHPFHGYSKDDVNLYIAKLRDVGFRPVERLGHTVLFIKSPPRELHLFVENPRQARQAREIIGRSGKSGENARVFVLDMGDSSAAIKAALEGIRPSAVFYDAAVSLTQRDRELIAVADHKTRMGLFRDALFDYCNNSKEQHPMVMVLFDDSSPLGLAVSQVSRNLAIERVLIQADFLGFVSKTDTPELSDRTRRFGATRPDLVCVWGPRIAERLTNGLGNRRERVIVTGCSWPMEGPGNPSGRQGTVPGKGPRVLWVDQPVLETCKVSRLFWLRDVARLSEVLSSHDCRYLPAPDAAEATLTDILGLLDPAIRVCPAGTERAEALADADVCVTWSSNVFLECLSAGVPCVFVSVDSLDIEMPVIRHPLLWRAEGFDALRDILARFSREEHPVPVNGGEDLAEYIASGDGLQVTIGALGGFLSSLEEEPPQAETEKLTGKGFFAEGTKTVLAIGGSFGSHIGVGMSLAALYDIRGRLPFRMKLHLCNQGHMRKMIQKVRAADVIIINSLEVLGLLTTVQMNDLIRLCHEQGRKVCFYPHETNYTFLRLALEQPDKIDNFLRNLLPTVHMLCVSEAQQSWLRGLGAASTSVVHEAVAFPFTTRPPSPPRGERSTVTMAGSIQPRKGVTLFSRTADLAADQGLPLDFQWLGQSIMHAEKCHKSDKVSWRGFLAGPEFWAAMSSTDVFALSSVDDPFPLSVGQALFLGKPCVVYRESGFADVIRRMGWGEVCESHDEHEFLEKIRQVAANPDAYQVDFDDVSSLLSVDAFARKLIDCLEAVEESPCFDRKTVEAKVGAVFLGECEFFELPMTLEEEAVEKRRKMSREIGFRVAHQHFEMDGVIPVTIRNLDPIDLKPIEMAKAMLAIGRHDVARKISEACLVKNPGSKFHQQILDACKQAEKALPAKPAK